MKYKKYNAMRSGELETLQNAPSFLLDFLCREKEIDLPWLLWLWVKDRLRIDCTRMFNLEADNCIIFLSN